MLFLTLAQSQGHRQPPNCSPEADHSHGCRSKFFISCSFEQGREDCPLRVHTRSPFPDGKCSNSFFQKKQNKKTNQVVTSISWDSGGGSWGCPKLVAPKKIKNHVVQISRFCTLRRALYVVDRVTQVLPAMLQIGLRRSTVLPSASQSLSASGSYSRHFPEARGHPLASQPLVA